ncbi:MAG TPA: hypothetical protein VIU38_09420 [Anaerolineales bacterium]
MKHTNLPDLVNTWTILGALLVAACLLGITLMSIGWTSARQAPPLGFVPADITLIPPSTATANPTATAQPSGSPTPVGQIGIGAYVQITGTEGAGLRIRREPGQNGDTVFLGEEAETFIVKDGPQEADGYTWWYLVAPYDETRSGWAAADYLAAVPAP